MDNEVIELILWGVVICCGVWLYVVNWSRVIEEVEKDDIHGGNMSIDEEYQKMTLEELKELFDTLTNTMARVVTVMVDKAREIGNADRL